MFHCVYMHYYYIVPQLLPIDLSCILVTSKFTLFRTTKDFIRVYINLVPMVICKRMRMKIEWWTPGGKGWMFNGGLLLGCDIS